MVEVSFFGVAASLVSLGIPGGGQGWIRDSGGWIQSLLFVLEAKGSMGAQGVESEVARTMTEEEPKEGGKEAFLRAQAKIMEMRAKGMLEESLPEMKIPPTKEEAAKDLTQRLKQAGYNLTHVKELEKDRDLMGLEPEKAKAIQRLVLMKELSLADEIRIPGWLKDDEKFREAFERRRAFSLMRYGFLVDQALAHGAVDGDASDRRLYYQRTGALPVGGSYVKEPESMGMDKDAFKKLLKETLKEMAKENNGH